MKFVQVTFNKNVAEMSRIVPLLERLDVTYDKEYYPPSYSHKSGLSDEEKEHNKKMEAAWKNLSDAEAVKLYPAHVRVRGSYIINMLDYEKCFRYCEVQNFMNVAAEFAYEQIDLDVLADKLGNAIIGKTGKNLFNNKLEIHQPNSPLFMYNCYTVLTDCCTEKLQNECIDNGWRVVAICPQPDQRRPDYIIAKYVKDKE